MSDNNFQIVLYDNSILKSAFESITDLVDEVACEIDSEGFRISAMDRAHICFVMLDLKKEVFDEYTCEVPERICIDTREFMNILKRCKTSDILKLSISENNLIIILEGDVTRRFRVRLIDLDYDSPKPPSINLPSCININTGLLKDCLTDMELFGENLTFKIDEDYFISESDGDFGDSNFKYLHGANITGNVVSRFSIDKLKSMLKASKFSESIDLHLGDNLPLLLEFKLSTNDGILSFLLAPRLETEEE